MYCTTQVIGMVQDMFNYRINASNISVETNIYLLMLELCQVGNQR